MLAASNKPAATPEKPTPPLLLAGVMGWPISHSRSPRLHGYWLHKHRVAGAYLPLLVLCGTFERWELELVRRFLRQPRHFLRWVIKRA